MTREKLALSQAFARKQGLFEPHYVMVPRTKGFVATVSGLRNHAKAVYDLTIGYPGGIPSLWDFMSGYLPTVHINVIRIPIDEVPTDEKVLAAWLVDRFKRKDELLTRLYQTGSFA